VASFELKINVGKIVVKVDWFRKGEPKEKMSYNKIGRGVRGSPLYSCLASLWFCYQEEDESFYKTSFSNGIQFHWRRK
jgi:hypothetical protein